MKKLWGAVLMAALFLTGCGGRKTDGSEVRVGFFPNLTHAQALVGLSEELFQEKLGADSAIKPFVFNAGPALIEALFAGEIDIAYVGPNPAVNGYVKSGGTALKVVAGACSGGAILVVRPESGIREAKDFAGKKVASPQLGNTQDIALRSYLVKNGLQTAEKGGAVQVIPMQNPDILTAFVKKEIDAAWVPEPWGTRLIADGGAELLLDERDLWPDGKFVTTTVIANTKFLNEHPDLVSKWLQAHVEVTQWITSHPEETKQIVNQQIEKLAGKPIPVSVLNQAWSRVEFTHEPLKAAFLSSAESAFELGFLGKAKPDLSGFFDLNPLNRVLKEKGLPEAQ